MLLIYVYLWRTRIGLSPRWRDLLTIDAPRLKAVMHIGVPTFVENAGWLFAFMLSLRATAQIGATALATHTYLMQLVMAVILVSVCTGVAVEIVVGRLVGAGKFRQAMRFTQRGLGIGLVLNFLIALTFAMFSKEIMRIFTADAAIIALGAQCLWLGVIIEPGRNVNIIMMEALRATGDASYPAKTSLPSMLLFMAGGAWFFGLHLGYGLLGVWIAYAIDEWVRAAINYHRWWSKGWIPAAQNSWRKARSDLAQIIAPARFICDRFRHFPMESGTTSQINRAGSIVPTLHLN